MRFLFLHNNFPAQYRHIITALGKDPSHQVVFGTHAKHGEIPGVVKAYYGAKREVKAETHHYLRNLESAVLNGQGVYRMCVELKKKGFYPDIVCAHSGWGPGLFVKDVFPNAKYLSYFEWFYRAHGSDSDFLPDANISADDECRIRVRNSAILLDLASCDWGLCPTEFQRSQFPDVFKSKLSSLHDGVDTDFFKPDPDAQMIVGDLDLSDKKEVITYSTRGQEPYRGFPQFMRAVERMHAERPDLHVVVVGQDRVAYGKQLPEGQSYRKNLMAELNIDPERIHFTDLLPYGDYLKVLQASKVHYYSTVPFVLSWSMIESLATGCLVVASDTEPVREVIKDGRNGLLVDFFDEKAIADRMLDALDNQEKYAPIRKKARELAVKNYDLKKQLPKQLRLIQEVANGNFPPRLVAPPKPKRPRRKK